MCKTLTERSEAMIQSGRSVLKDAQSSCPSGDPQIAPPAAFLFYLRLLLYISMITEQVL